MKYRPFSPSPSPFASGWRISNSRWINTTIASRIPPSKSTIEMRHDGKRGKKVKTRRLRSKAGLRGLCTRITLRCFYDTMSVLYIYCICNIVYIRVYVYTYARMMTRDCRWTAIVDVSVLFKQRILFSSYDHLNVQQISFQAESASQQRVC